MTIWSPQQDSALKKCKQWIKDPTSKQVFYLAGYAGTGKTTLAKHLVAEEGAGRWLFAAFTGKASFVLRQKGCSNASTIHSLIYRPAGESKAHEIEKVTQELRLLMSLELSGKATDADLKRLAFLYKMLEELNQENRPQFALWANSPLADSHVDGIVIDEVSMVDERIGKDLESFGKKILVLGDPAQLPPVGSGGYYTKRNPDVMLREVHRHARESGILRLATIIREGGNITDFDSSTDVKVLNQTSLDREYLATIVMKSDQTLCGLNKTRHAMNRRHRILLGIDNPGPVEGDRVVCLLNDHDQDLFD